MTLVRVRIEELRKARNWSQAELARRSNVPQATISRIEAGLTGAIEFSVLERLGRAFGVHPGYLIDVAPAEERQG